jgi:hypothetical protein
MPGNEAEAAFRLVTSRLVAEMVENEEEIDIDCCDECSSWTVTDRRCSCGNRRMELTWTGTFEDPTYYAEAY